MISSHSARQWLQIRGASWGLANLPAGGEELQALPAKERERWVEAMRPIEPINFVGRAAPAALLVQAGTEDENIPQTDARRYHQAASPSRSAGTRPAMGSTAPPVRT
jgi:hypothetical protein